MVDEQEVMATITLANGKQFQVSEKSVRKIITRELFGTERKERKSSINGAPLDVEVSVLEKDGKVVFRNPAYKTKSYSPDFVAQGVELVLKEKWALRADGTPNLNKRTGVRFVEIDGRPFGENLAQAAIKAGIVKAK